MKYFITLMFLSLFLSASLLDFKYLEEAKKAYNDKNYTKAQENYAKVHNDEARFNEADSLYRQKRYKEAIEVYKSIVNPKLEAKKLHNIGNSYAYMKKIDEAINSYEDALKLGEDNDTKFNLELLKKKKEEQKKKKDKKDDKKKKDDKNKKEDKNNKEKKDDKNKKESDKNKSKEEKDKEKKESDKKKKEQENKEKNKKKEDEKKQSQMNEQNKTQAPISNMEERKWQKMLNKRGVNTLMIPLNKGEKNNETNPW